MANNYFVSSMTKYHHASSIFKNKMLLNIAKYLRMFLLSVQTTKRNLLEAQRTKMFPNGGVGRKKTERKKKGKKKKMMETKR